MNKLKIDQYLSRVLQNKSFDSFTVTELRDAYMEILDIQITAVEARKFIYRQVLRFLRLGLFKKEAASNARDTKYIKTPEFFKSEFKARSLSSAPRINSVPLENQNKGLLKIEEQLKQYKVDLLASVGESEEYMRLYKSNPEFKVLLETEYHQARDQSSRLLGQIKALKTVLTHYSN